MAGYDFNFALIIPLALFWFQLTPAITEDRETKIFTLFWESKEYDFKKLIKEEKSHFKLVNWLNDHC